MNMNRDEYEMQLYGLTQDLVLSSVKETFKATFCVFLKKLLTKSRKLVKKCSHEDIDDFKTALINAYNISMEKHNADLEKMVAECFSIDLLPEDEMQRDNRDGSYEAYLKRKFDIAKRQLIGLTVLEEKLKLLFAKIAGDRRIVDEILAWKDFIVHRDSDYSDLVGTLDHAGLATLLMSKLSLSEHEKK